MIAGEGGDLLFDEASHAYSFRGGGPLVGVTSAIAILDPDAVRYYTEAARLRGEAVHLATQYDDEGRLDEASVHPVVRPYLSAWRRFRRETGFTPTLIEARVYSRALSAAGTLDRLGMANGGGEFWLLDIKTGARSWAHDVQIIGYETLRLADLPSGIFQVYRHADRLGTVYLSADGSYDIEFVGDAEIPVLTEIFNAALVIAHGCRRFGGGRNGRK